MIINLWTTPRSGSNWYARKLVRDYQSMTRSYCLNELFNRNIYGFYYRNDDGKVHFVKDFTDGCFYIEYKLDKDNAIIQETIYSPRVRSPEDEEKYRIDLIRAVNRNHVVILSNHVSPISPTIYDELVTMADKNIYLHRKDIRSQLASYCISYATKQFISFTDNSVPAENVSVPKGVVNDIAFRILHWHSLDKSEGKIIDYESINFVEYTDAGMPKKQNKKSTFDSLDSETQGFILEAENYICTKIPHFQKDEQGVTEIMYRCNASRIMEELGPYLNDEFDKTGQLFITARTETKSLYEGYGTYKDDEYHQFMQYSHLYVELNEEFTGTYISNVVNDVSAIIFEHGLKLGRVRVVRMTDRKCYSYHRDPDIYRFHIPIVTSMGNFFIVSEKLYSMSEVGQLYMIKTSEMHTAINASFTDRYHLIFDTYI